jgi:hypothetical protein
VAAFRNNRAFSAAVLLAVLAPATPARAQAEPVRLTYRAPPGCPDEAQFLREVAARTGQGRRAARDEPGRSFAITVTAEGNGERGVLTVANADGAVSRREVVGDTCNEVVLALALMTALAIDPAAKDPEPRGANDAARVDDASSLPQGAAPAASTVPQEPPSANPRPAPAAPQRRPGSQPSSAFAADVPPRRPDTGWQWSIGAEGQALAGLAPGLGAGAGAFVDVTDEASPGPLALSFRATLYGLAGDVTFAGPVGARLEWLLARVEGCPFRFSANRDVTFFLCAALDVGVLQSEGTGLATDATQTRGWLAPSALGRVAWSWPGRLFVEGGVGLTAPVTHYGFYYQQTATPDRGVYTFAAAGATANLGAGYRFP